MDRKFATTPETGSYRLEPGLPAVDRKRQYELEMKKITDKAAGVFKRTLKRELNKIEKR